jgi:hypothetical protein
VAQRIRARVVRVPGSHFKTLVEAEHHTAVVEFVDDL